MGGRKAAVLLSAAGVKEEDNAKTLYEMNGKTQSEGLLFVNKRKEAGLLLSLIENDGKADREHVHLLVSVLYSTAESAFTTVY